MKTNKIKRILWTAGSIFLLCIGFLLCRYAFFELHGMKEWPLVLFVFGLIVICIAAIFNGQKIMLCTALGYSIGFALGALLNADGVDYGGTTTNNLWIWFTFVMVAFVFIGVVWEIAIKRLKAKLKAKSRLL